MPGDFVTNRGAFRLGTGATVWNTATLRMGLLKTAATPDRTANVVADVVAASAEVSVGGYARQGPLGSKTTTEDDALNRVEYACADQTFAALAAGQNVGWAFIFDDQGSDATSPVLCCLNLGNIPTNGDLVVHINAAGAMVLAT